MTDPKRHDWPKIIAEVKAGYQARYGRDLSDYRLGVMCADADKKVVRNWQHGVIPDHYRGCLLLEYRDEFRSEPVHVNNSPNYLHYLHRTGKYPR